MHSENLQKGQLLIAEPSIIGDSSFNRSVILLAEHNEEGSVGFILNKPLSYSLQDLIPEIEAAFTVYDGGPVEQDNLYFIHTVPELLPNSTEISNGIYWGGDFERTKTLINNGTIQRDAIRFFLGYSGWDAQQLEHELQMHSWIVCSNTYAATLLTKNSTGFWKEKIVEMGGDYLIWSNAPENPILN
ncbi:YqgE/AlgH family protein [Flavobacterium sp.]|uniref:YqgE/AlgH family protein n=1 Tax=Flavobacterium sp. TaxID=239 RepID=UPI00262A032C|nr:YqgE/AlgH family protein [Flavobacterium sp.]